MTADKYHDPRIMRKSGDADPRRMSPDEFRRIIKRLKLSQKNAGKFMGQTDRNGTRSAKRGLKGPAAMLLRLIDFQGLDAKEVEGWIEMHRQGKRLDNA